MDFVALGALASHEDLRRRHRDDFFRRNFTVFVSHQWLGRDHPDPDGVQYAAICASLADLAAKARRPLRDIFVWLDYGSIPQTCKPVQRLSVLSLPSLASAVDVFLAAAPKALNRDTLEACDAATYASRAWCRAEIFAHFSRRGGDVMYFATADGVRPMFPKPRGGDLKCAPCAPVEAGADFFKSALDVMHGKLTCCRHGHASGQPCDREELVLPLMGLFSEVYRARGDGAKHIYGAIVEGGGADYYFPHSFDYVTPSKTVVRRVLFGDLPRAIMAKIDADLGLAPAPRAPFVTPGADTRRDAGLLEEKSSSRGFFARPRLPLWRASVSTADSDVRDASLGDSDGRRASGSFDAATPADELLASDSLRHDADDKKGAVARLAATPTTEFREVGLEVP